MIELGNLATTYDLVEKKSFSATMRIRRFKIINTMIETVIGRKGRCNILDIGGSKYYWDLNIDYLKSRFGKIKITMSNLEKVDVDLKEAATFNYVAGDAMKIETFHGDYDLIHSNSVIEHVGSWNKVRTMADNIKDIGLPYYVQTPNYWFPVEPHFRTVGFQWLPLDVRARMLLRRKRGFYTASSFDEAMEEVESINLLTRGQLGVLFPDAEIRSERLGPFTKSFMVMGRHR